MVKTRRRTHRQKMRGGDILSDFMAGVSFYGNAILDRIYSTELSDVVRIANSMVYMAGITAITYGAYVGTKKILSWFKKVDKYLQRVLFDMNSLMKMIATLSIDKFTNVEVVNDILAKFDGIDASLKYVVKNYDKIQNDFNKEKVADNLININLISHSEILRISKNVDELNEFFKNFKDILMVPGIEMGVIRDKYLEGLKRATHIYKLVNIILLSNSRVLDILSKADNIESAAAIKPETKMPVKRK